MHWMMEYFKPVDIKAVYFAKKMLKNPIFKSTDFIQSNRDGKDYIINNICVSGYTVKDKKTDKGYEDKGAVFFISDSGLIQLGLSYYPPIRFSVPKSHLLEFETDETQIPQTIKITEWAYNNCYMLPVKKILENWGKMIGALFRHYDLEAWDLAPMFKYSPYKPIIEELHKDQVREMVKDYNKKKERNIINNPEVVQQKRNEEPFRKEAEYIFYTDGSGNWYSDEKRKDKGHFSVYLKNTEESWKRREDKLTSNQAELLGVMSAISIANKRKYKNVLILTDSNNVVNWCIRKKDNPDKWFWEAKHPNVIDLVKRLREMLSMIPQLTIKHIPRERNFAHGV